MNPTTSTDPWALDMVPLSIVRPEVLRFLLMMTYTAFLVPIAVVLLFFSTRQQRRRPIFILNVCTIALGIAQGIIGISISINIVLLNLPATPSISVAAVVLIILVPFSVEGILLIRVCAAYPPKTSSYARMFAIYGPIVLFKTGRAANISYLFFQLVGEIRDSGGLEGNTVFTVTQAVWIMPNTKIEWFLQLFDDMYVSALFIMRVRKGSAMQQRLDQVVVLRTGSYTRRLTTLFWAAVSNFVFPVICNITLIALVFHEPDSVLGSYLVYTNNYVQIIGVLLATVFVAERQSESRDEGPAKNQRAHKSCALGTFYTTRIALQSIRDCSRSDLDPTENTKSRGDLERSSGS